MNLLRAVGSWMRRVLTGSAAAVPLLFASTQWPVAQEYPPLDALSTMARFPWIVCCVTIISDDLAGRPLVATRPNRKQRRARGDEVEDRALDLLENPNAATTGFLFRKQLWIDWLLAGNAYLWAPEGRDSVAIYRLHPNSVRPQPGPMGTVALYEWTEPLTGQIQQIPPEQIIHVRDVSWQDNVQAVFGESVVRCLHDALTTELGARTTAKEMAQKGRPDILFSVKSQLGDDGADKLVGRWEKSMRSRHGAFVVGADMTATPLSWTPKEFDFHEDRAELKDITFAVFGVPKSRAGLVEDSNYAVVRQAEKTYWERNRGRCKVFDDAFSKLAQPGVRVSHDFSDVEALQVSYTERQARVQVWVDLGWSPEDAAAYEGFEGLPPRRGEVVGNPSSSTPSATGSGSSNPDEPDEPADKAIRLAVLNHLREAESDYASRAEDGEGADWQGLAHWEGLRLSRALVGAGLPEETARAWASDTAQVTDRMARHGHEGAFSEERASQVAARIVANLRRAA